MWSGPQWTQWALNPSAYQDMANDQVDWARLAQQWIMMKESEPVAHPPVVEKHMEEEGGEAPMDIGKDEDEPNDAPSSGAPPSGGWNNSSNWNNWQQQWGGYNSWPPGSQGSQIPQSASNSLLPTPSVPKNGADNAAYSYSTANSGFEYSTMGHREDGFQTPSGYWPDGVIPPGAGGAQMPFVRGGPGRGHRWEGKVKYPRGADMPPSDEEEEAEPVIDAAKRRSLPIWIREGLEKMEREKQKRMEREKAEREREEVIKQRRQQEQEAMNEIQAEKGIPPKSKFDTDSGEESEGEAARHMSSSPSPIELVEPPKRKSRFHDGPPKPSSPVRLTKEEQMLKVRRSMTEILLEVTNEMIHSVARDSYLAAQRKAPAKQTPPKKSMAVASLTGNLGLAMYGSGSEGDSDSDSDQEGEASRQRKGANSSGDSDSELKDEIRRRQQDFREKEREIEAFAAEAEDRERRGGRGSSVGNNQAAAVTSAQQVVTDSGNGLIPERQVESESASHTTDGVKEDKGKTEVDNSNADRKSNDKNSYKSLKTDKKKKSESSHSSDESSSSSRDSKRKHKRKHKERRKEKRRSKERDKRRRDRSESRSPSRRVRDRKSRRDRSSSSKRSKSRSRSRHRDDEKKRKQRRDRSDSRRRSRKRSHSSDSDYRRHRRRSRSRSGSSRRHRRRRSSSRSSSQSSRHHRSARR